jgi:uncharacterized protein YlzI (FlbEa/FlbD family)
MRWSIVGRAGRIRAKALPSNVIELRPQARVVVLSSPYLSILRRVGPLSDTDKPLGGNGAHVIAVEKLNGAIMHLNEDLIERVESASGGQSAVYLRYGAHMILANDPDTVVEMIRAEKTALLRRVFDRPEERADTSPTLVMARDVTVLSQVRGL